jgi:hypothetical protein
MRLDLPDNKKHHPIIHANEVIAAAVYSPTPFNAGISLYCIGKSPL